jgi:hypothetical protein
MVHDHSYGPERLPRDQQLARHQPGIFSVFTARRAIFVGIAELCAVILAVGSTVALDQWLGRRGAARKAEKAGEADWS